MVNDLSLTCLQSLSGREGHNIWQKSNNAAMHFIKKAFFKETNQLYDCLFKVKIPVVGIGAPVRSWLPKMAEKLHTELLIPEHAEVANAIGAAAAKIMETVKVLIKPGEAGSGYLMHAPWERKTFDVLEEAVEYALAEAKTRAASAAEKAGCKDFELVINHEDVYVNGNMVENDIYVESRIEVTAVGRPIPIALV